ncbi:MAG: outer membrane beta-barrel protein [Acidobacteriota bacterium]|nr:outer membrane beta-barrel protein [Acidobacteriota bacterium]
MKKYLVWLLIIAALPLYAQPDNDTRDWFGLVSFGYTDTTGDAGELAKDGLDLAVGAIYWPSAWKVGLQTELTYNGTELRDEIERQAEADDSRVDVWSLTTGFLWARPIGNSVAFNVIGGIGGYHLDLSLTEPGFYIGPICDPWLWYCYPGIIEGDVVTASRSTTKLGYNLGVGLSFKLGEGYELLVEARYNRVETQTATEYIPFNIGFRF